MKLGAAAWRHDQASGRRGWLREAHRQLEQQRWRTAAPISRPRAERLRLGAQFPEDELAAECRGNRAYEELREYRRLHDKRRLGGPAKPYAPPPVPQGEVNLTDPDSRRMKGHRRYIQGYNAQAVVNEQQIVIAAEITTDAPDFGHLRPMLETALAELERAGDIESPRSRWPTRSTGASGTWITSPPSTESRCGSHLTQPDATENDPDGLVAGTRSCGACSRATSASSSTADVNSQSNRSTVTPNTTARSTDSTTEAERVREPLVARRRTLRPRPIRAYREPSCGGLLRRQRDTPPKGRRGCRRPSERASWDRGNGVGGWRRARRARRCLRRMRGGQRRVRCTPPS